MRCLNGTIELISLPDNTVDVIISNCVINLSADTPAVFREALRVLKPGGQFAVSDVVIQGELDAATRTDMEAWAGCVAGTQGARGYLASLGAAGFEDSSIEVTRVYAVTGGDAGCCRGSAGMGSGKIASGFIRATKPV